MTSDTLYTVRQLRTALASYEDEMPVLAPRLGSLRTSPVYLSEFGGVLEIIGDEQAAAAGAPMIDQSNRNAATLDQSSADTDGVKGLGDA